jgi:hypothetical protein
MKNKLPGLTAIVLVAVGAAYVYHYFDSRRGMPPSAPMPATAASTPTAGVASESPAPRDPAGDQLIARARNQLERRASVSAKMRHQVSLGGRQLFGVGSYFQQGSGEEMRVRLELLANSDETGMVQISNGRELWTDQRLPVARRITRLNLTRLRYELNRDDEDFEELRPGAATWSTFDPEFSNVYGGLPSLLASLSDQFEFLPPQAMRWTPSPPIAGLPESVPVFAVVGHWRPEILAAMLPDVKPGQSLPERLPQEVLILFGQTDLFPYRIEYRPLFHPPATTPGQQVAPFQLGRNPVVMLELSEVSFDVPIAAGQFNFSPGDAEWDDRTAEAVEAMRQARQVRMAAQEAARR